MLARCPTDSGSPPFEVSLLSVDNHTIIGAILWEKGLLSTSRLAEPKTVCHAWIQKFSSGEGGGGGPGLTDRKKF